MHRATPLNTSIRSYTAGGARSVVDKVDDKKAMQEMSGNFMINETRSDIESPQNYGFTSVVRDAEKDGDGKITASAETFIGFMGGNRSFPVAGPMDDRRFRLKELEKGDVALFDYLQHQLHFNNDGIFITGRTDKKLKFQLAEPPQDDQQQSSSNVAASQHDSQSSSSGKKNKGQKKRYDKQTGKFLEMTKDTTNLVHDQTINYKTGVHTFSYPDGGAAKAKAKAGGGFLVKIMGDKFTNGFGEFTKQVTAAAPVSPQHLTTKGYVDAAIGILKSYIDALVPHLSRTSDNKGLIVDGDLTVTGDLIVNGVVRARDFIRVG
jgi:phage gp45-like